MFLVMAARPWLDAQGKIAVLAQHSQAEPSRPLLPFLCPMPRNSTARTTRADRERGCERVDVGGDAPSKCCSYCALRK
jgi:hypothetical protein